MYDINKLSFAEFKTLVKKIASEVGTGEDSWRVSTTELQRAHIDPEENIYFIFEVGGVSGGSCWESSNPTPYRLDDDVDKGFVVLDEILEKVAPNISLLKYRKLMKHECNTEICIREYYGNRTDYKVYYMSISQLYHELTD